MHGNLPRACSLRRSPVAGLMRRGGRLALGSVLLLAVPSRGAGDELVPARALKKLAEMRLLTNCLVAPTDDVGQALASRGRTVIEIKGRQRGGDAAGTMRDLAVLGVAAERIATYVCFPNASTRVSGEAIVSLPEVSSRADRLARSLFPGANLELESIKRHRTGGAQSIYYEARYASVSGEHPFLDPPVRMLLNATTGSLFRLDIDPDWLDPADQPHALISRKAAERVAAVVLRSRDLAPALGPGAVFAKVSNAEMFTVHPNDWLGLFADGGDQRARVAWVVPFRVDGGDFSGLHSLFIDATTGVVLGGRPGQSGWRAPK